MAEASRTNIKLLCYVFEESPDKTRKEIYSVYTDDVTTKMPIPSYHSKKQFSREIMNFYWNTKECKEAINESYLLHVSTKNPILILLNTYNGETTEPIGFICASYAIDNGRTGFNIDVICSRRSKTNSIYTSHIGVKLLEFFADYARLNGGEFVGLTALPTVLAYYPKRMFEFRKTCDGEPLATLPEDLINHIKINGIPKTEKEVYKETEYVKFMIELQAKGLNDFDPDEDDPVCAPGKRISTNTFVRNKCGSTGFKMKRCFTSRTKETSGETSGDASGETTGEASGETTGEASGTGRKRHTRKKSRRGGKKRKSKQTRRGKGSKRNWGNT